jgi:hypothetical protein
MYSVGHRGWGLSNYLTGGAVCGCPTTLKDASGQAMRVLEACHV